MITFQDHVEISPFFQFGGITSIQEREDYLPTQLACFIEEAEEIGETLDKVFDTTGELKENLADDVADTLFSGIGVVYMMHGAFPDDDPYDFIDEYHDLLKLSEPEVDSCYFVIKNEVKNLRQFMKNKNKKTSWPKRAILTSVQRVIANAIVIAEQYEIDAFAALDIVTESNFQKFDYGQDDALTSHARYASMGLETLVRKTWHEGKAERKGVAVFTIRVNGDQTIDGKLYPDQKILKSHTWMEPRFGYK